MAALIHKNYLSPALDMEENYKVSVLIPVYNVSNYIEKCARSVFSQTYQNLEIIFVDDCSHDNSISIIRKGSQ